jgi:hypothetical protein
MNYVAEYIDILGASCAGIGRLNIYIKCIVKYIDAGGGGFMPR